DLGGGRVLGPDEKATGRVAGTDLLAQRGLHDGPDDEGIELHDRLLSWAAMGAAWCSEQGDYIIGPLARSKRSSADTSSTAAAAIRWPTVSSSSRARASRPRVRRAR